MPGRKLSQGPWLMALVAAGCAVDQGVPLGPAVRDSAGVRIVEHPGIPLGLPVWTLSDEPEVSIGAADGAGPEVFGRVVSVAGLSDGNIVVGDALALQIRVFDRLGNHLWTAGGRGQGPGQLSALASVHAFGPDSVVTVSQGVIDVFDGEGRFARRVRLPASAPGFRLITIGGTVGGRFVGWGIREVGRAGPPSGAYRDPMAQVYFEGDGALAFVGPDLPGTERFAIVPQARAVGFLSVAFPWGRETILRSTGTYTMVTSQDRFEVMRVDRAGQLESILRVDVPPIPLDDAARAQLPSASADDPSLVPEAFPAIGKVRVDSDHRLWVQEFLPPYLADVPAWWVFDEAGDLVARAVVPEGFQVELIGTDDVVGLVQDELDVQYIQVRRIVK